MCGMESGVFSQNLGKTLVMRRPNRAKGGGNEGKGETSFHSAIKRAQPLCHIQISFEVFHIKWLLD